MVFVALDVGNLAFFHVNVDPAAAGAHVTCGFTNLVGNLGRCVQYGLVFGHLSNLSRLGDLSADQAGGRQRNQQKKAEWTVVG